MKLNRPKMLTMALTAAAIVITAGCLHQAFAAFPSDDVQVLEEKDIAALSDDQLRGNYIDVLAEIEASRAFHTTSGFTPKEYAKYKSLVKYRLQLLFEIHRRNVQVPPTVN